MEVTPSTLLALGLIAVGLFGNQLMTALGIAVIVQLAINAITSAKSSDNDNDNDNEKEKRE